MEPGARTLELGKRTLIMGIVNVTPDLFLTAASTSILRKLRRTRSELLDQGADIIDIGGESTRPGAKVAVSAEEELQRVLPVITA